jgi:flagellin-specific chaperone FliS
MTNSRSATQIYRTNQVNTASPLEMVIMAYDAALMGCRQQDLERTTKALSVLRNALDFNHDKNFAMGLLRLYQYCSDLARKGQYDEAAKHLREVREAWAQVLEREKVSAAAAQPQVAKSALAGVSSQLLVA